MKDKKMVRRITQYILGLVCMVIGTVLLKRVNWGISPITSVADAFSYITPLTIGNLTIIMHAFNVLGQIIIQKKVTIKSILCMGVGFVFGYMVDLFMLLFNPSLVLWSKILCLILGLIIQGIGVACIFGCDMMLPAPDEMNAVISKYYNKKLSNVKRVADLIYVVIALIVNLFTWIFAREQFNLSVGISSVASVLLTGTVVGIVFKLVPKLRMEPFFTVVTKSDEK